MPDKIDSQRVSIQTLATLIGSKARVVVLSLFLLDPHRAYYQRQIEAATGLPIRAVQRELERLTEVMLLYRFEEGNRAYYQVDLQFPLYEELRAMVLKSASPVDRLRGMLAVDAGVRLAFLSGDETQAMVVYHEGRRPGVTAPEGLRLDLLSSDEFMRALTERPDGLARYVKDGTDLLGRRDDVIWRRIETAGHTVKRRKGVA
jgi:DNA-binding transcriptional ArsR family regulator